MQKLGELKGFEAKAGDRAIPTTPEQVQELSYLTGLVREHHDAIDPRGSHFFWLGNLFFDLTPVPTNPTTRMLVDPQRTADFKSISLLVPNQLVIKPDIQKAYLVAGHSYELAAQSAQLLIEHIATELISRGGIPDQNPTPQNIIQPAQIGSMTVAYS